MPHGMHMTGFGFRRRISNTPSEPTKTDEIGAKLKLGDLVKRARDYGLSQGPLKPIEALITTSEDEWTWQIVDRDVLNRLSHRLVFQSNAGMRREILMTEGLELSLIHI